MISNVAESYRSSRVCSHTSSAMFSFFVVSARNKDRTEALVLLDIMSKSHISHLLVPQNYHFTLTTHFRLVVHK
jgi:hypothetical protein